MPALTRKSGLPTWKNAFEDLGERLCSNTKSCFKKSGQIEKEQLYALKYAFDDILSVSTPPYV